MRPVVLVLALAALCYAGPVIYGGPNKTITVNPDSIVISVANGLKKVTISKQIGAGEGKIDVEVTGQNIPPKRFQINDEHVQYGAEEKPLRERRSPKVTGKTSQFDLLSGILKEFQGPLDAPLYEKLLKKLYKYVEKGQLNDLIYQVFVNLDKTEETNDVYGRSDFQQQEEVIRQYLIEQAKQQALQQSKDYFARPELQQFYYPGQSVVAKNPVLVPQSQFPAYQWQQYYYPIYQGKQNQIPIYQQQSGLSFQTPQVGRVPLEGPQVLPYSQSGPGSVYGLLYSGNPAKSYLVQQQQPLVGQNPYGHQIIPSQYLINDYGPFQQLGAQARYGQQVIPKDYLSNYFNPIGKQYQ